MTALKKELCEAERQKMKEKLKEEDELRDKLTKSVQQLEQRKREIQRELKLRNLSSAGSQLKSAIVVPRTGKE